MFQYLNYNQFDCSLEIRLIESKCLKMTKAIQIIEFSNWENFIWSTQIIDLKKRNNVWLNNIFNLVNFHDVNFSIFQIEMQKEYEFVAILPIFAYWFFRLRQPN